MFGLLKIRHWCGNDPVRYHLARVDLTNLILASGGKADPGVPLEKKGARQIVSLGKTALFGCPFPF